MLVYRRSADFLDVLGIFHFNFSTFIRSFVCSFYPLSIMAFFHSLSFPHHVLCVFWFVCCPRFFFLPFFCQSYNNKMPDIFITHSLASVRRGYVLNAGYCTRYTRMRKNMLTRERISAAWINFILIFLCLFDFIPACV